jgi:uncharacterized protein
MLMETSINNIEIKFIIMDKNELEKKTKKAVQEVSTKLKDLKNKLSQDKTPQINSALQAALNELHNLNQMINKQYENMRTTRDISNVQLAEMDKNIFNSIESFNNAYTKAGSLFKIH